MPFNEIDVNKLKAMLDNNVDFILLDVRNDSEVLISNISKSIHIPMNDIPNRIIDLDKSKEIVVYCKSGIRSAKVCEFLNSKKFKLVKNLKGGILSWAEKIDTSIIVY